MLDGRVGPGGENLRVGLSRPLAVYLNQMRGWIHEMEDMEKTGGGEGEEGEASSRMSGEGLGGLGLGLGRVISIIRYIAWCDCGDPGRGTSEEGLC